MMILSQRSPIWGMVKMGSSPLTLAKAGCTTTCLSMLSDYFKCYKTPPTIAHDANNYTKDGLIVWNNLKFDHMKFVWREYSRDDQRIKDAIKDPNKAVMLQVSHGSHWVVAIRRTLFGNSYIVADPWDATKPDVIVKYHDITGAAFFERK